MFRRSAVRVLGAALAGAFTALLLTLASPAAPAAAHAWLVDSSPAEGAVLALPPTEIRLQFNEVVTPVQSSFQLISGSELIQLDPKREGNVLTAALPDDLQDGNYLAAWRVVSSDGHPVGGAISFTIGTASEEPPPPLSGQDSAGSASTEFLAALLNGIFFISLLSFAGLLFFRQVLLPETLREHGPSTNSLRVLAAIAATAAVLGVPMASLRILGASPGGIFDTQWLGALWPPSLWQAALALTGLALALAVPHSKNAPLPWLGWSGVILALASPVLLGHTRSFEPQWFMQLSDGVHLAAGAYWLGGLVGLVIFLRKARLAGVDGPQVSATDAAAVVARFSGFALWSAGAIALSGLAMASITVGSPLALLDTDYGRLLMIKVGLVIFVAGIALWNRNRLVPMIAKRPASKFAWRKLLSTLLYESVILVLVLGVTGFLTNASPRGHDSGSESTQQPTQFTLELSGGRSALLDYQPTSGTLTLQLFDEEGAPLAAAEPPGVSAELPELGLGPLPQLLEETAPGVYSTQLRLPLAGVWRLQISVVFSVLDQSVTVAEIPIA